MTTLDRRSFLRNTGGAAALGIAGATPLSALFANTASAQLVPAADNGGYGPISPKPERNTGELLLQLPEGFSYIAFSRVGEDMANSEFSIPGAHDGMAAFPHHNNPDLTVLVRNHERSGGTPYGSRAYSSSAAGGTTNILFNHRTQQHIETYPSLTGTIRNCAGGPTPQGSWLSCEETTISTIDQDGTVRQHGYVFEVPSTARTLVDPVPLKAMGVFSHEAVAVDPATGFVYETEDAGNSGFYRFRPFATGQYSSGILEMLAVAGRPQYDTDNDQTVGQELPVTWVTIDDPDPAVVTGPDGSTVYSQGKAKGGARFVRGEGCWYGNGSIFFVSTSGGNANEGQVWEYIPSREVLRLVYESPSAAVLDNPDNITVAPSGALLVFEDGSGTDGQYVRGITLNGEIFDFARSNASTSEFAGGCFGPDSSTLFFNQQGAGLTFAVTGPFDNGVLGTGMPAPVIPEVPTAALLPAAAVAVGVGALALRNRGQRETPATPDGLA